MGDPSDVASSDSGPDAFFLCVSRCVRRQGCMGGHQSYVRGRGISYQAYEPAEGGLHYGEGRQRRIRAGLRYSKGGKQKYWIPTPGDEARSRGETGVLTSMKRKMEERRAARKGHAPLLPNQAARVISTDPTADWSGFSSDSDDSDAPSLTFDGLGPEDKWEESIYKRARKIEYVGYPNVDVSKEEASSRDVGGRTRSPGWGSGSEDNVARGLDRSARRARPEEKGRRRKARRHQERMRGTAYMERVSGIPATIFWLEFYGRPAASRGQSRDFA